MQTIINMISGALMAYLFCFTSCSTLKKNSGKSITQETSVDTSKSVSTVEESTTVTEKAATPYNEPESTLNVTGYYPYTYIGDTTTHTQEQETDDLSVKTTIKPRVRNGKTQGFDVNTTATKKAKTIDVPINRTTVTTKKSSSEDAKGVTVTKKKEVSTSTKERTGISALAQLIIGLIVLVALSFGIVILWLKK